MSNSFLHKIRKYAQYVTDFDFTPYESIDLLDIRTSLHENLDKLTDEEKYALRIYDLQLLVNSKRMHHHLSQIYDFSKTTKPYDQWWWHLHEIDSKAVLESIKLSETKKKQQLDRILA